jgi:hypothetical protein
MSRLFDVAEVIRGDTWTDDLGNPRNFAGVYDRQYDDQVPLIATDICTRTNTSLIAGVVGALPTLYTIRPFGVTVSASRPNRCILGQFPEFEDELIKRLDRESERAAAATLYGGVTGWDNTCPYLLSSDVTTVGSGTTVQDTVPSVMDLFYAGQTGQMPILHLGQTAGVKISAGNALSPTPSSKEFFLAMDGTPINISPEFPTNFVAVTGPITIHLGSAGMQEPKWYYDSRTNNNRSIFTAERVMSLEFNAIIAVRAT